MANQNYIITSLNEDEDTLITSHYIDDILPETEYYKQFDLQPFLELIDNPEESYLEKLNRSKDANERQTEERLIIPVLKALGNKLEPQSKVEGEFVDFCLYNNDDLAFKSDFKNTIAALEAKHYGRIENNYFIKQKNNKDEIYQPFQYLKNINTHLSAQDTGKTVDFIILTDGYLWRLYSRKYTYSEREFQNHFLEFNLEAILNIEDREVRDEYLKKFAVIFSENSLKGELTRFQKNSDELQKNVTTELKEQTFTALEYIATGLWRELFNPVNVAITKGLSSVYGIDIEKAKTDENIRRDLLKIVYDESVVFLLRVLFILYAEDRNLFDESIPKLIKGENGLLSTIKASSSVIGEIEEDLTPMRDDDADLKSLFTLIDNKYNGGLFSAVQHQLIQTLNLDDTLFLNAIDNLCRVSVKNKIYTVDFSTISARELGSIYESLLEYKLTVAKKDYDRLPSIINKKRIRKNVKKGDLYLINQKGERKSTGSYYTDDLIVEHLVNTTLESKLQKIKKEVIKSNQSYRTLLNKVLEIKICDPAMGSGHFLLGAYSRLISFLHETLEEFNEEKLEMQLTWNEKTAYKIRSLVARRCIYGVDLNENAVEIAKLVLWMKVFRPDKPFEFFDTNLVCGNSLIGLYEDLEEVNTQEQLAFFESKERMESRIQKTLLERVEKMMEMPRDTRENVYKVKNYYETKIEPLQQQIAFMLNMELAEYLAPEKTEVVNNGIHILIEGIETDEEYVQKIIDNDSNIPTEVLALKDVNDQIIEEYNPLHWKAVFPHIAVQGGFDIILSNPPWDKVKGFWHEFLADYREEFSELIGESERTAKKEVFKLKPEFEDRWNEYNQHFIKENTLFNGTYEFQITNNKRGKRAAKGDNNLFKLFIEKIYTILNEKGITGLVVPDNLNLDAGTTGLRKLLLENTTIHELIMFENRLRIFKDVDSRYKFNVLTFEKRRPRKNATFEAGFYWYDPIWLDNTPSEEYLYKSPKSIKDNHKTYKYPLSYIKNSDPTNLTIQEFKDKRYIDIFKKLSRFPKLGDENQELYIKTYSEFHMTKDKDLFNKEDIGWPLYQGKTIHHYTLSFNPIEKWIDPIEGEDRLAKRKKLEKEKLPDREYRIAWRNVAQPTDSRSLICTVIPKGIFTGNSLNVITLYYDKKPSRQNFKLLSGVNTILSSFTTDFFIRQRIAKNISASFLKELPVPRDIDEIKRIGEIALPLYAEDEMEEFREGVGPVLDENERQKLTARLDAEVAHLYHLNYNEYQFILRTFPQVDEDYKKRCLMEFNKILFK